MDNGSPSVFAIWIWRGNFPVDRLTFSLASPSVIDRQRFHDPLLQMGLMLVIIPFVMLSISNMVVNYQKAAKAAAVEKLHREEQIARQQWEEQEKKRREEANRLARIEEREREAERLRNWKAVEAAREEERRQKALLHEAEALNRSNEELRKNKRDVALAAAQAAQTPNLESPQTGSPKVDSDSTGMPDFMDRGTPAGVAPQKPDVVGSRTRSIITDIVDLGTPDGVVPKMPEFVGVRAHAVVDLSQITPDEAAQKLEPKCDFDLSQAGMLAGQVPAQPAQDGERANLVIDFSRQGTPLGAVPSRPKPRDEP